MAVRNWFVVLGLIISCEIGYSLTEESPERESNQDHRRILIISLDGFGRSYVGQFQWKYLTRLYVRGSVPEVFRNQFVTKTFPNHFSVATGLYEEVHGVVGNNIYDPTLNRTLEITDKGFFTQNPNVSPVWTLNEANGGHSGCVMWPGCGETYHGQNVTFWSPYRSKVEIKESISTAVQWITDAKTPANLVFLYHEQPDAAGHAYGPNSTYITEELQKIDEAIGFLYQLLTLHKLQDAVDVIVLSDHGMSAVPETNIINLAEIVDPSLYHVSGGSPVLSIWTKSENALTVYSKLQLGSKTHKYKVYLKEDIPEEYHYKNNPRISRILVVAEENYVFEDFRNIVNRYKEEGLPGLTDVHGDHGYPVDVSSMEPIFVASGPSFKRGFKAPAFSNIDLYPLLCHLLSLTPGNHNGTMENISSILSHPVSSALIEPLLIALGCLVGLMGVIGVVACTLSKRDSRHRVSADSLINGYVHRKTMRGISRSTDDDATEEEEALLDGEVVTINF